MAAFFDKVITDVTCEAVSSVSSSGDCDCGIENRRCREIVSSRRCHLFVGSLVLALSVYCFAKTFWSADSARLASFVEERDQHTATVIASGTEYKGDCFQVFQRFEGPCLDALPKPERSQLEGTCHSDWAKLFPTGAPLELEEPPAGDDAQGPKRLRRLGCQHRYLSWILVRLDHGNETRCAFPYGSKEGSVQESRLWHNKEELPKVGTCLPVWSHRSPHRCIVGFDDPSNMVGKLSHDAWTNYVGSIWLGLCACLLLYAGCRES